jgi:hypothetical protein
MQFEITVFASLFHDYETIRASSETLVTKFAECVDRYLRNVQPVLWKEGAYFMQLHDVSMTKNIMITGLLTEELRADIRKTVSSR